MRSRVGRFVGWQGVGIALTAATSFVVSPPAVAADGELISAPLSSSSSNMDVYPDISGELAVWYSTSDKRIYLYDLATRQAKPITQLTVATPTSETSHPRIAGDLIVWDDYRTDNWDIFICQYNRATGQCPAHQLTSHPANQFAPDVSTEGVVVWIDVRGSHDIYACLYDRTLGQCGPEHKVSDDPANTVYQDSPSVSGRQIVWLDARSSNAYWDTYTCLYDPATGGCPNVGLTVGIPGIWRYETISGRKVVTFYDTRIDPTSPERGVYLYDLDHPELGLQPLHIGPIGELSIDGDYVVWSDYQGSKDLFALNLTTRATQQLTTSPAADSYPEVSDGRVVYQNLYDVYLLEIPGAVLHPPTFTPVPDQQALVGQQLLVSVTATDLDGDRLTLTARLANGDPLSTISAAFQDHGNGTGTFSWTPTAAQAGMEALVSFVADDGKATAVETITIRVRTANLLLNPSFEEGITSWSGWGKYVTVTTETASHGTVSSKWFLGGYKTCPRLFASTVPIVAGGSYQIHVVLKTRDVQLKFSGSDVMTVGIKWKTSMGKVIRTDGFGTTESPTDWKRYSSQLLMAPSNAAKAGVYIQAPPGSGILYVDDVQLVQVP